MKYGRAAKAAVALGEVVCVVVATFLAGFASSLGAALGGMRNDRLDWAFAGLLVFGWALGAVVAVVAALALARTRLRPLSRWIGTIVLTAGVVTLVQGVRVSTFLESEREERRAFAHRVEEAATDGDVLDGLLGKARRGELSPDEARVLRDAALRVTIPDVEIDFLLGFYVADGPFVASIVRERALTMEQLRNVYDRHNHRASYDTTVLSALADHANTPRDVLQQLAEDRNRGIAEKARTRLASIGVSR